MREGRGHIAAAALSPTIELKKEFAFSPNYRLIQYQLVYRASEARPKSLTDAANKRIAVIADTPAHDMLRELTGDYPRLIIDVLPPEPDREEPLNRGYGTRSDFYLTPWGDPVHYGVRLVEMSVLGALSVFGPFAVDAPMFFEELYAPWLAVALIVGGALCVLAWRSARALPLRWFLASCGP